MTTENGNHRQYLTRGSSNHEVTSYLTGFSGTCGTLLNSYGEIVVHLQEILTCENKHCMVLETHYQNMTSHYEGQPKAQRDPRIAIMSTSDAKACFDSHLDKFVISMRSFVEYEKNVISNCLKEVEKDCYQVDQVLSMQDLLHYEEFKNCRTWYWDKSAELQKWKYVSDVPRLEEFLDDISEEVHMLKYVTRLAGIQESSCVEAYLEADIEHQNWKTWQFTPQEERYRLKMRELLRNAEQLVTVLKANRV